MAQGPPPSEAGPSNSIQPTPSYATQPVEPTAAGSYASSQSQYPQAQVAPVQYQNTIPSQPYLSSQSQFQYNSAAPVSGYAYYNYPSNWNNSWQGYPYGTGPTGSYQYAYPQRHDIVSQSSPVQQEVPTTIPQKRNTPTPSRSPSPPPPPPFHKEWDRVIKSFLQAAGLTQTLRGFEVDMVVMSPDWEKAGVPSALKVLLENLSQLGQTNEVKDEADISETRPLEERKLSHVHFAPGAKPRTPTSMTKDISLFLARNRVRNDGSNRKEFLLSLAEKRRKLRENPDDKEGSDAVAAVDIVSSCARTDAKTQDRDIQMKYDIAKNEDGPLRKTMKAPANTDIASVPSKETEIQRTDVPTTERYPALEERLRNVETHLAVRHVPSPPRSLLDRLQFLEDHIIHLEKQFPPWAALHFNQPNRGWPPPPRLTPIIVPSHLTSSSSASTQKGSSLEIHAASIASDTMDGDDTKGKMKGKASGRNNKSSLHRAVMERLEVQKAMNDLAGVKTEEERPS